MNRIITILNSKYFLSVVIGLSILTIVVGVILVQQANQEAADYEREQKELAQKEANLSENSSADTIEKMQILAAAAQAELSASVPTESSTPEKMDFSPESSLKKIQTMENKDPEVGSEDWCEVLMVKPSENWNEADQASFAKNCLD
jgi:biopolymer transport protein ExbB/TolQ